jgi:hypothetical protein
MRFVLFALFLIVSSFAIASGKYVITPFGVRLEQCVLELPSGSTVSEGDGHLLIKRPVPNTADQFEFDKYEVPPECHEDIPMIYDKMIRRIQPTKPHPELDINGWLDYGGWYPPSGESNLQSFTVNQTVPGTPGNPSSNQVLFYFIGMQDNDSPGAVNIVQPVLTWGNGYNQWYIKSWACCPNNITTSSDPVFGLQDGDTFQGVISRESPSTWKIDSVFNGRHTTLNAQVGDYIYNWADVTLEVYEVTDCSDFAPNKAYFKDLDLMDDKGETLTPQWTFTGPTSCSGSIVQDSPTSVYIEHTP